jgi:DNA-binding NarL/FixJ family response regulator
LVTIVPFCVLLVVTDCLYQIILTNLIQLDAGHPRSWLAIWVFTAACAVFFARLADRGLDRVGLVLGLSMALVGILVSLLGTPTGLSAWLLIAYGFGGGFTLFALLSFPLHGVATSRFPAFINAAGIMVVLVRGAILWPSDLILPQIMAPRRLPMAFHVAAALVTIGLLVYSLLVLEYQKERNLASAIVCAAHLPTAQPTDSTPKPSPAAISLPGLGETERKVADLLIKGNSKGEIARRPHLSAAETADRIERIRATLLDPQVGAEESFLHRIQAEYRLTTREVQVLARIRRGRTNAQMAQEHTVTERSVKFHVCNLLRKLHAENRPELRAWMAREV